MDNKLKMKKIVLLIIIAIAFSVNLMAGTPQPVNPTDTTANQKAEKIDAVVADDYDEFKLDFDLNEIGAIHHEYFVPLSGYDIAEVGILVVFASLIIIATFFTLLGKFMIYQQRMRLQKSKGGDRIITNEAVTYSDEINAAISTALLLYFNEVHDEESGVLTINKIERRYSPWSSKIYNMNSNPFN